MTEHTSQDIYPVEANSLKPGDRFKMVEGSSHRFLDWVGIGLDPQGFATVVGHVDAAPGWVGIGLDICTDGMFPIGLREDEEVMFLAPTCRVHNLIDLEVNGEDGTLSLCGWCEQEDGR